MTSRKSTSSSDVAHDLVLAIPCDDEHRARRIAASLQPEVGDIAGDRTRATLERDGKTVRIRIAATDLVGLRAGVNTWTTLLEVAECVDGLCAE